MFDLDTEIRKYIYYGLMAFSVLFLIGVFGLRYLTRHSKDEDENDREEDD
jgi:preprotein translocase subunit SecG